MTRERAAVGVQREEADVYYLTGDEARYGLAFVRFCAGLRTTAPDRSYWLGEDYNPERAAAIQRMMIDHLTAAARRARVPGRRR